MIPPHHIWVKSGQHFCWRLSLFFAFTEGFSLNYCQNWKKAEFYTKMAPKATKMAKNGEKNFWEENGSKSESLVSWYTHITFKSKVTCTFVDFGHMTEKSLLNPSVKKMTLKSDQKEKSFDLPRALWEWYQHDTYHK